MTSLYRNSWRTMLAALVVVALAAAMMTLVWAEAPVGGEAVGGQAVLPRRGETGPAAGAVDRGGARRKGDDLTTEYSMAGGTMDDEKERGTESADFADERRWDSRTLRPRQMPILKVARRAHGVK